MKVSKAVDNCLEYHRVNSQRNTLISYEFLLSKFSTAFGDRELGSIVGNHIVWRGGEGRLADCMDR
jgi:hypothetical protein